jgi:GxxExxY protein
MNRQDAKNAKFRGLWQEPHREVDERAHAVIGAAIEVHRHLGPGFLESVYEHALAVELKLRNVHVEQQVPIPIVYKGRRVSEARLDLLVGGDLVVELKAVDALLPIHTAQVMSYLRAGSFQLGLLINFNVTLLRDGVRRIVFSG